MYFCKVVQVLHEGKGLLDASLCFLLYTVIFFVDGVRLIGAKSHDYSFCLDALTLEKPLLLHLGHHGTTTEFGHHRFLSSELDTCLEHRIA